MRTCIPRTTTHQSIAHWLTDNENHRTKLEYENSVILKRFFFESFDCYRCTDPKCFETWGELDKEDLAQPHIMLTSSYMRYGT